jgi:adenosylcobinamide kinase/adenosylcobinamide-phosphate guanylyltransferase
MSTLTMLTGGARSGKSRFALELAGRHPAPRVFVATAEACDAEMADRIARHRAERGTGWQTVEAPLDLAGALRSLPAETDVAVVDCLTVWLGNLMHHRGERESYAEVAGLLATIEQPPCDLILVTNELGMSIIPDNPLARRFRDVAGRLNQEVARRAGRVLLMVSGLPLALKGEMP